MENIEMRVVLREALKEFMTNDERVMVLDADLAKASGTHPLQALFPERAIDVGIAEADMASIAAGLSSYGFIPFITSFAPFVTRRMCDQLMLSICYAQQNVKIVGTDPGISAELNGGTHMGLEDIGVIRSFPNITIFEPVDAVQLKKALPIIKDMKGVVYIRLFRKVLPTIFDEDYKFDLYKADVLKEGKDVTIVASGIEVFEALDAVKLLEADGISAELIAVHTVKPIDVDTIAASARKTGCVVTAENHNVVGGLFSATAEALAKTNPVPMEAIGVPDTFGEVGKMPYLKEIYKMRAVDIADKCKKVIKRK